MKLIIGLGNPGSDYAGTRHNAGFEVVDAIATANDAAWSEDAKRHALVARMTVDETPIILAKPTSFMNESGTAVQALASYYKVAPEEILVIQDEMDILPGKMAFIASGGAAGHNGITDIQEKMGRTDINRLRIGIGRPTGQVAKESWVLEKATGEDKEAITAAIKSGASAATDWATIGLAKAMNRWN